MNLRGKIIGILLIVSGTFMLGGGCDSVIYEDMLDCPQGVYLKFYSKTPCDADSLYPANIKNLHIYVFDANDKYVNVYTADNVTLSKNYEFLVPIYPHGKYSFVAWSGIDSHYTLQSLQAGVATKDDLLLQLKRTADLTENIKGTTLCAGTSPYVFLPDPEEIQGAFYEHTAINMTEYTNRVEVIVEGFSQPEDYVVDIAMRNGDYAVKGNMLLDKEMLHYPPEYTYIENKLSAKFTMLKLETGYDDWLKIKTKDGKTIFYQEDFLGTLLLQNPDVNLSCEHDFVIRFKVEEDHGSYYTVGIWINGWRIHSYNTGVEGGG
ncbi:MAG: hypothetical protein BGO33_02820 [Bacteroidia bacterium 43-41]|nr:MAG: hypothetical protein BGO33_02820 [Bacteroidia bacterium 43-41]